MVSKIAIFSDERGWHTRQLQREFFNRGLKTRCVDLSSCDIKTKKNVSKLFIPGFGSEYPQYALVRGISSGSFEQITKRLAILHLLSSHGVKVVNKASSIEKSVDKSVTSYLLRKNNIPTPNFWVTESLFKAKKIITQNNQSGKKIVLKPLFGSQGQGLILFGTDKNSVTKLSFSDTKGGVFYLQQFVPTKYNVNPHDYRVFVIKNKAIAAMKRIGKTWIHNKAMGAQCEKIILTKNLKKIAENATKVLDLDIAGVDLIPDETIKEGFQIIEVNGIPAWKGLQSVCEFNVTKRMLDLLLENHSFQ